jgi:hypothetical protein
VFFNVTQILCLLLPAERTEQGMAKSIFQCNANFMGYIDKNIYYYYYEDDANKYYVFFANAGSNMKFETAFKVACYKNAVDHKNDRDIVANINAIKKEMEKADYKTCDYEMGSRELFVGNGAFYEGKMCLII